MRRFQGGVLTEGGRDRGEKVCPALHLPAQDSTILPFPACIERTAFMFRHMPFGPYSGAGQVAAICEWRVEWNLSKTRLPRSPTVSAAMPEQQMRRRNAGAPLRRAFVLDRLARPRTQRELQEQLHMSASGTLHLLRRMERDGLVRAVERVAKTQIWERVPPNHRDTEYEP